MIALHFEFIVGFALGIEHVSGDEDDDFEWAVGIHLGIIRISLVG